MGSGNSRNGRVAISPASLQRQRPNAINPAVNNNFVFNRNVKSSRSRSLINPNLASTQINSRPTANHHVNLSNTNSIRIDQRPTVVTVQPESVRPKITIKKSEPIGSPEDLRIVAAAIDDFKQCQKAVETDKLMTSASLPYLEQLDRLSEVPRDSQLCKIWIGRLLSAGLVPTWLDWWKFACANGVLTTGEENLNLAAGRRNFVFLLRLMWTAANNAAVCDQLISQGGLAAILSPFASQSGFQPELLTRHRQRQYFVVGLLGVTLNCLRLSRLASSQFRTAGGFDSLLPLTTATQEAMRLRSQFCIAAAGDLTVVTDATVRRAVELLSAAWKRPSRIAPVGGLTTAELLDVINRLANCDDFQAGLIRAGMLRLYATLLDGVETDNDDVDVIRLLQGVWAMSFLSEGKSEIRRDQKFVDVLQRLKSHRSRGISRGAGGSLWTVAIATVKFRKSTDEEELHQAELLGRHVLISYEWGSVAVALGVRKTLNRVGFATWADPEKPDSSTLDTVASAVESAAVVIILASDAYMNSPACRAEAEYSYVRHKRVVGLLVQKSFRPDGWLGAILAGPDSLLDFCSDADVTTNSPRLVELLKRLGVKTTDKIR